jgi:hypothetical protein
MFWKIFGKIWYLLVNNNTMKKTVMITEKELNRLVKKIVNEQGDDIDYEFIKADDYAGKLKEEMESHLSDIFNQVLESIQFKDMVLEYQNRFKEKYPQYVDTNYFNDNIDSLLDISTDFENDSLGFFLSISLTDILSE